MKKIISGILVLTLLLITIPVYAANNGSGAQGTGSQQGTTTQTQQRLVSPSPTGNTIQNQNQVKTQNEGEVSEIRTNTQEQESQGNDQKTQDQGMQKETLPQSETAEEDMNNVTTKIEELLTTETARGGIGEQVRLVTQEQKTAQEQMQGDLKKVDSRKGLLKSIIGPDFQALKNVQKIMEQNQLRIQQLAQLKNQLTIQGEITQVQEMIQALTNQNTALQYRINFEEQSKSLFGWLLKLFAK